MKDASGSYWNDSSGASNNSLLTVLPRGSLNLSLGTTSIWEWNSSGYFAAFWTSLLIYTVIDMQHE